MSRYTGPKNRIARRFGANIFSRARNPLAHKANPPGQHGAARKKNSDYAQRLIEKQKLRAMFGMINDRQLTRYFHEARRRPGVMSTNLLAQLECRLDNVVYRLRLAPSIFAAQQLVNHGHVQVNGKRVDIRSFQVKPGMKVSLVGKAQNIPGVVSSTANTARAVPAYLEVGADKFSGQLLASPEEDQVPMPMPINLALVCEFLSLKV